MENNIPIKYKDIDLKGKNFTNSVFGLTRIPRFPLNFKLSSLGRYIGHYFTHCSTSMYSIFQII